MPQPTSRIRVSLSRRPWFSSAVLNLSSRAAKRTRGSYSGVRKFHPRARMNRFPLGFTCKSPNAA